jgi:arylsulfatase B
MSRHLLLLVAAVAATLSLSSSDGGEKEDAILPHIFMLLLDDFGFANIGIHRTAADDPHGEVQTPAMDALAAEGVQLNRNYLFWYCSPSRSSLQTGRNPILVNVNNDDMSLVNPQDPDGGYMGIPRNMTGIGHKIGAAGYETHFYGKWHIGLATDDHTPAGRGWQNSMIYFDGANDYWNSQSGSCKDGKDDVPITDLWLNSAPAYGINNSFACSQSNETGCVYEDAFFFNQTLTAIKTRDKAKPLFLIWAPHNIHAPLQVPADYLANFSFISDPRRQAYAAKVKYIDDKLAVVVQTLKDEGLWSNLLFVLSSDNGGPIYDSGEAGANNWPLKVSGICSDVCR